MSYFVNVQGTYKCKHTDLDIYASGNFKDMESAKRAIDHYEETHPDIEKIEIQITELEKFKKPTIHIG